MRLTDEQRTSILTIVHHYCGDAAAVYLFGSRCNDASRGGDVDLLIEHDADIGLLQRAKITQALQERLFLPVDIVAKNRNNAVETPFQHIARAGAERL